MYVSNNDIILNLVHTLTLFSTPMVSLTRPKRPSVLFISVDGVRPDLVFGEAFSHVKIPNIRKILKNAAFSKGVTGIEPTLTYPSHCTLTNSGIWNGCERAY
mgnify:CR=1 FL=1